MTPDYPTTKPKHWKDSRIRDLMRDQRVAFARALELYLALKHEKARRREG